MRKWLAAIVLFALVGFGFSAFAQGEPADIGQNRVFYEIFVPSFSDSNGDGIGDLQGIINRLDYLNGTEDSLGIGGIWLTPIYQSPSYHKYDVADYYTIDPSFGDLDTLKELIAQCHARDIWVILDLPINHTSTDNRWFVNFKNAHIVNNPSNIHYDFYTWQSANESLPAGRHFIRVDGTQIMVEANFSDDMPELNFDCPAVRQAVVDVARYYLELGVDGFRFDAAKYVYYGDHDQCVDFWDWYVAELKKIKPDVYCVAEVWDSDSVTDRYGGVLNCFDFTTSQSSGLIAQTAAGGNVNKLTAYMENRIDTLHGMRPDAMPIYFIANHDTDRAAGFLTVASGRMQMAANLYLLCPGSPFIYYGEEIGMRGSRGGANTDANRRLAMLWGDGDTVSDPIGTTYDAKKQSPYTVAELLEDEGGLLQYYRRLLTIRRENPEIAAGKYTALSFADTKAGGFVCTLNESMVCVLHNTTTKAVCFDLTQICEGRFGSVCAVIGLGGATLENGILTLDGQTSVVLR